jgi:hypothetical protein
MRWIVRPSRFVTQTEPAAVAVSYVTDPTLMRASTRPVAGSTRSRRPECVATQIEPYAKRSSHGVASTLTRPTTVFVSRSMRRS